MGAGHSHAVPKEGNERRLWLALGLTTTYLIAEVIGGVLTGSLALISDAAHMFTDGAALAVALAAVRIGKRPADAKRTYGYYRFEILAAAFNAVLLFLVAVYVLYEAFERFQTPQAIESTGMVIVASIGLVVNLVSMRLLSGGKDTSLNVKGAYLEVWSDMLGSIGVIVGAVTIRYTGWLWIDTVIAVAIGLWVLPRTWILLKDSLNILLEGAPEGVGVAEVEAALTEVPGVASVHDLHIWSITSGKVSLTAHIVCASGAYGEALLYQLRERLEERYHIHHSTLQLEVTPCEQATSGH